MFKRFFVVALGALAAQTCFAGAFSLDSGTLAQPVQLGVDANGNQNGQDLDVTGLVPNLGSYYGSGYGVLEVEVKGVPTNGNSQVEASFIDQAHQGGDGDVRFETKQIMPGNDFARMFPTKSGLQLGADEQNLRERFYLGQDFINPFDAVQSILVRVPAGGVLITQIKVTLSDEFQPRQ